jgi:hypothetical protein
MNIFICLLPFKGWSSGLIWLEIKKLRVFGASDPRYYFLSTQPSKALPSSKSQIALFELLRLQICWAVWSAEARKKTRYGKLSKVRLSMRKVFRLYFFYLCGPLVNWFQLFSAHQHTLLPKQTQFGLWKSVDISAFRTYTSVVKFTKWLQACVVETCLVQPFEQTSSKPAFEVLQLIVVCLALIMQCMDLIISLNFYCCLETWIFSR